LLESHSNGRGATASLLCFHDHDQLGHPDKDVIPLEEVSPTTIARELRSELRQSGTLLDDLLEEILMFGRVDVLQAGAHHSESATSGVQGPTMGGPVYSPGQATHNGNAGGCQLRGQTVSSPLPFLTSPARPDDGHRASIGVPELSHMIEPDGDMRQTREITGKERVSIMNLSDLGPVGLRSLFL
jgi:hypothetical protein